MECHGQRMVLVVGMVAISLLCVVPFRMQQTHLLPASYIPAGRASLGTFRIRPVHRLQHIHPEQPRNVRQLYTTRRTRILATTATDPGQQHAGFLRVWLRNVVLWIVGLLAWLVGLMKFVMGWRRPKSTFADNKITVVQSAQAQLTGDIATMPERTITKPRRQKHRDSKGPKKKLVVEKLTPEELAVRKEEKRSKSQDPSINYSKPSKDSQETILGFLTRRFPYHTNEKWKEVITAGNVSVNGQQARPGLLLGNNDRVSYRSSGEEPEVDPKFAIIHQDEDIVIVRKSGRIPVAEGGRYYQNVLVRVVQQYLSEVNNKEERLWTVHRLDRETSGTVILARTLLACQQISEQLVASEVQKVYYAVLVGDLMDTVDCKLPLLRLQEVEPLGPDCLPQVHRLRMACHPNGKASHTRFIPVHRTAGLTLCRIQLFTGRTHQIRAHAFGLGYPLLGDKLYGQTDQAFMDLTMGLKEPVFPPFGYVPRHLLHAADITFQHPVTGKRVHFTSSFKAAFEESPYVAEHLLPGVLSPEGAIDDANSLATVVASR